MFGYRKRYIYIYIYIYRSHCEEYGKIIFCVQDADQLLEKRVRSRFSHRKLLFLPPSKGDIER